MGVGGSGGSGCGWGSGWGVQGGCERRSIIVKIQNNGEWGGGGREDPVGGIRVDVNEE